MAFPNAEIMVPAKDWEFWMSDENAAKAQSNEMMKNYFANVKKIYAGIESKVTKYDWGKEVAPGITSIATPGHTPGHTSFAIARAIRKSCFSQMSPTFRNCSCAIRIGTWPTTSIRDMAQTTRHKFYDMAAAEKATGGGLPFHLPLDRACREGRHQVPADPGRLESGDLIVWLAKF